MRKIFVQEMITVDGFFAGPGGEIDWHNVDAEFNEHAIKMLESVDTLIFGRVTYDLMASYWTTEAAQKDDPTVAGHMNSLPKLVFSHNGESLAWNNSTLKHVIEKDEIIKMKESSGKDMVILGSGTIVSAFANLGLIDEYHLIVNPVALGKGKTLFAGLEKKHKLKLVRAQEFKSGNVLLVYEPA